MASLPTIYLDVETTWSRELTVIGLWSREAGYSQLVGGEITRAALRRSLPRDARLVTFNGHSFDLPVIRKQLSLDLRSEFESMDLRWIAQRCGLNGGQKAIERRIQFRRKLEGLDGRDAVRLWKQYEDGAEQALETLLRYNREDLDGMRAIAAHLMERGVLPR